MIKRFFASIYTYFAERILLPDAPADTRLGQRLFVIMNLIIMPSGLIGMVMGLIGGSPGMITLAAFSAVVFPINFLVLSRNRKFNFHFQVWVLGIFLLMLIWGVVLGGFRTNFSVYWVAFLPLLLVVLVADQRRTIMIAFVVFTLFTAAFSVIDPFVDAPENAPSNVNFANTYTVLVSAGFVLLMLDYYKREKNKALHLLNQERERADALLLNILPGKIADILKVNEGTIAEQYESASILFADLVNFTPLTVQMTPAEMIELLNTIYSHFDSLSDKYGVEKIRTIGDSYMVASGIPTTRPDHAQALAHMALDMLAFSRTLPDRTGRSIQFRIGIHSGPLVAGVIGKRKFHYDVWGDTVNTASRMESHGLAEKIQITSETRDLIRGEFFCEKRGIINVKGKGDMETWWLIERK